MPQLKNTQTGETFDVSDVDAARMSQADPSLQVVGDIATSAGPDSRKAAIARSASDVAQLSGVTPATADELAAHSHAEYLKDKSSTFGAAARGLASFVSFGGTDLLTDKETREADELHHGIARLAGEAAGAFVPFGEVGGLFRGAQVGEDALTAERAASSLSSNFLHAGEVGGEAGSVGKSVERSIARGSEALKGGAPPVAQDLAELDAKGLRAAEKSELDAIEQARVPQRAAVADDIAGLRAEMKADKTWLATKNAKSWEGVDAAVKKEVSEIGKVSLDADRQLDRMLRNPKAMAARPQRALDALQQQEAALERLAQQKEALSKVFAADASGERVAALESAGKSLERNRAIQARIGELVAAPASERLAAIADARDALGAAKDAPKSWLEHAAGGAAFSAATALAAPLGHLAPIVGAKASKLVTDALGGRLAKAVAGVDARSKSAVTEFLDVGKRVARRAPVLASQVLAQVRYAPMAAADASPARASGSKLADSFHARAAEIRSQTMSGPDGRAVMRPEARLALGDRLDGVRVMNRLVADRIETVAARRLEFLASKLPRRPDVQQLQTGPDRWQPSDMEMRQFARYAAAVEDPGAIEERLADGSVTPEDAEVMRQVYPERFAAITAEITSKLPELRKTLPYQRRLALSIFTGVPVDPAMHPQVLAILQGTFATEEGSAGGTQALRPQPAFGSVKKSAPEPTPAQSRSQGATR